MLAHHVARQIDPDGDGPAPSFVAQCDMINDEGGWMLVTPAILGAETKQEATDTQTTDARGGVVMRVYVSSFGCGSSVPPTRHRIFLANDLRWTRLRVSQTFAGSASCWHIFGGQEAVGSGALDPNLFPFDVMKDVVRDAVRMGGSLGNAFDGDPVRCDQAPENCWDSSNGSDPRSATSHEHERARWPRSGRCAPSPPRSGRRRDAR